jgi:hypothetical protein
MGGYRMCRLIRLGLSVFSSIVHRHGGKWLGDRWCGLIGRLRWWVRDSGGWRGDIGL